MFGKIELNTATGGGGSLRGYGEGAEDTGVLKLGQNVDRGAQR